MANQWERDLKKSSMFFMEKVWPKVSGVCGGGKIKPVEVMTDNQIANDLDLLCGIDVWQSTGVGARGIASRVQFNCGKAWNTFTIRYKRDSGATTEYEKRLEAIKTGRFIYPYLTCQAYFDKNDSLLSAGIARTLDIFNAVGSNPIIRRTSNASFIAVNFDDVKNIKIVTSYK